MADGMVEPETFLFPESEWVPNHPFLPVLAYRKAFASAQQNRAAAFERRFREAGWQGLWRNGVFDYQHYHVGAHEVLGIAEGNAVLLVGGPTGARLDLGAGDCLVLPAGTGHRRLSASDGFLVVGGYPPGQHADIQTAAAIREQRGTIGALPLPASDPLHGEGGPLNRIWEKARRDFSAS